MTEPHIKTMQIVSDRFAKPISAGAWYFMAALLAFAITIGLPSIIIGAWLSFKLSGL